MLSFKLSKRAKFVALFLISGLLIFFGYACNLTYAGPTMLGAGALVLAITVSNLFLTVFPKWYEQE